MKYRKKPIIIEAYPFLIPEDNQVVSFVFEDDKRFDFPIYIDDSGKKCLIIPTLEGNHIASVGDYIIRGIKGELYPCKPDIFESTYEKV